MLPKKASLNFPDSFYNKIVFYSAGLKISKRKNLFGFVNTKSFADSFLTEEAARELFLLSLNLVRKKLLQSNYSYANFYCLISCTVNKDLFCWSKMVKIFYKNRCMITNQVYFKDLHSHHLFSKSSYPQLQFLHINGLPIYVDYHKSFHHLYGNNVTISDFLDFLDTLLLSENATLDKNHLNRLKNWLSKIQPILNTFLCEQ